MIEKLIVLEEIDPVIFYGVNNANIQLIKALYPKLRIVARGNVIKVLGDEEEMCAFEENITKLEKYCAEYNSLKEEVIIDIIKGNAPQAEQNITKTSGHHQFATFGIISGGSTESGGRIPNIVKPSSRS